MTADEADYDGKTGNIEARGTVHLSFQNVSPKNRASTLTSVENHLNVSGARVKTIRGTPAWSGREGRGRGDRGAEVRGPGSWGERVWAGSFT
jgi:hypothetical protein